MKKITLREFIEKCKEEELLAEMSNNNSIKIDALENTIKDAKAKLLEAKYDVDRKDILIETAEELVKQVRSIIKVALKDNLYLEEKYVKAIRYFITKSDIKDVEDVEDYLSACLDPVDAREAFETRRRTEAEKISSGKTIKDDEKEEKEEKVKEPKVIDIDTKDIEKEVNSQLEKERKTERKEKVKLVIIAEEIEGKDEIVKGEIGITNIKDSELESLEYKEDVKKVVKDTIPFDSKKIDKAIKDLEKKLKINHVDIDNKVRVFDVNAKNKDTETWIFLNKKNI